MHVRVDKRDQLAAAQYKLVERVFGALGNVAWMDQQQRLDRRVDGLGVEGHGLDIEIALEFAGQHPGLGRLPRHHVERRTHHRQRAHHPDHRAGGAGHPRDGADQVVFEQAFALRIDAGDRFLAIQARRRQPEIELLAGAQGLRLDAVKLRGIFFVGIRLRVVFLDHQIGAGDRFELAQQVVDALREALQLHRHRVVALRNVEAHLDRPVELAEDLAGAFRQGVQLAVGEVGAQRRARGEKVDSDQQ